jgi:hypothetical protein
MKEYSGQSFTSVSFKIDGINARRVGDQVLSRRDKPLYNVPYLLLEEGFTYEIFLGSFKETTSVLRSHSHPFKITEEHIFKLTPVVDLRLIAPLNITLDRALELGYEGLVFDGKWKLKPKPTFDVQVLSTQPGTGKHFGRMGALLTPMGKVGTGFTDKEREEEWSFGDLIEVECLELTEDGKFRHPRFIRRRWDK